MFDFYKFRQVLAIKLYNLMLSCMHATIDPSRIIIAKQYPEALFFIFLQQDWRQKSHNLVKLWRTLKVSDTKLWTKLCMLNSKPKSSSLLAWLQPRLFYKACKTVNIFSSLSYFSYYDKWYNFKREEKQNQEIDFNPICFNRV